MEPTPCVSSCFHYSFLTHFTIRGFFGNLSKKENRQALIFNYLAIISVGVLGQQLYNFKLNLIQQNLI